MFDSFLENGLLINVMCVSVFPAGVQQLHQKDPDPPRIKEEPEEHGTGQDGDAAINRFPFTVVTVKSEDEEVEPQTSQLCQSQTEEKLPGRSSTTQIKTVTNGEDCRGPGSYSQPNTDEKTLESSETEVSYNGRKAPSSNSAFIMKSTAAAFVVM